MLLLLAEHLKCDIILIWAYRSDTDKHDPACMGVLPEQAHILTVDSFDLPSTRYSLPAFVEIFWARAWQSVLLAGQNRANLYGALGDFGWIICLWFCWPCCKFCFLEKWKSYREYCYRFKLSERKCSWILFGIIWSGNTVVGLQYDYYIYDLIWILAIFSLLKK